VAVLLSKSSVVIESSKLTFRFSGNPPLEPDSNRFSIKTGETRAARPAENFCGKCTGKVEIPVLSKYSGPLWGCRFASKSIIEV